MNKLVLTIAGIALIGLSHLGFSQAISVTRNMPSSVAPGGEFTVEFTVDKGTTAGFAKLQDEMPDGFTATSIESKSATFSFDKSKVKFIWMSLPADAKFTVSYKVKVDAAASGSKTISGTFSYIDGNDTKKISVAASTIDVSGSSSATSSPAPSSDISTTAAKTEAPAPEKKEPEKVAAPVVTKSPEPVPAPPAPEPKKVAPPAPKPVVKTSPSTPKAVTGIVFRVQIGAGQNSGAEGFLKSKYNIADEVFSEQIDGLYKYTAGSFSNLTEAKVYRDKIRSAGDDGAFIVSYQNGTRIPLQDALKSTGQ